jgi:hypothetical protein
LVVYTYISLSFVLTMWFGTQNKMDDTWQDHCAIFLCSKLMVPYHPSFWFQSYNDSSAFFRRCLSSYANHRYNFLWAPGVTNSTLNAGLEDSQMFYHHAGCVAAVVDNLEWEKLMQIEYGKRSSIRCDFSLSPSPPTCVSLGGFMTWF